MHTDSESVAEPVTEAVAGCDGKRAVHYMSEVAHANMTTELHYMAEFFEGWRERAHANTNGMHAI